MNTPRPSRESNEPVWRTFSVRFLAGVVFLYAHHASAAPCCAGSSSIPAIITGDDRAQVSASVAYGTVIGDAKLEGLPSFRAASESETTRTIRLDGAFLITDRFQAGAGLPLLSRRYASGAEEAAANHLGDLEFDGAYEFLPEWSYSSWKPRGHVFLAGAIPTGRSINESELPGAIDATGKGFYRIQTGAILTKRWSIWDANFVAEVHRSLPRTFAPTSARSESLRIDAGYGGSFAIGGGVSPGGGNLRIGLRIQPNWNSSHSSSSPTTSSESARSQTVDTSLEAGYLASEGNGGTWTIFGSYVDQTILGPARNATLSRTFALGLQHRWDR